MGSQVANSESFGLRLKQAREACGFDIETLARRLHIRPDILESIESADFERMPASGYTRNMVRAYARTVGLNQNEICDLYFQELDAFGGATGALGVQSSAVVSSSRRSRQGASNATSRASSQGSRQRRTSSRVSFLDLADNEPISEPITSDFASEEAELKEVSRTYTYEGERQNRKSRARSQRDDAEGRREGRKSSDRRARQTQVKKSVPTFSGIPHPNLNIDPKSLDLKKIIIAVIALIVVIVLVVFVTRAISSAGQSQDDVPSMPISGLTDTTS